MQNDASAWLILDQDIYRMQKSADAFFQLDLRTMSFSDNDCLDITFFG